MASFEEQWSVWMRRVPRAACGCSLAGPGVPCQRGQQMFGQVVRCLEAGAARASLVALVVLLRHLGRLTLEEELMMPESFLWWREQGECGHVGCDC